MLHRKTRPYTPKTNGMVERFNDRVQREVLGIMIYSHADLEIVLRGFNAAYNGRVQRVLEGLSPEMVLCQRLEADPALANITYRPSSPGLIKVITQCAGRSARNRWCKSVTMKV